MGLPDNSGSFIAQHQLGLKLRPILIGELYLVGKLLHPVYLYEDGLFVEVMPAGSAPRKELVTTLLKKGHKEVFVFEEDLILIKNGLEKALTTLSRSLSVGEAEDNGPKQMKLLSLHMSGVYKDPQNNDKLNVQVQSAQNFAKFLMENKRLQSQFYHQMSGENFHFTIAQPLLSSIMMLSFGQSIHLFHDREIEMLFLTSYFKDVGVSLIQADKYDKKNLTSHEEELFAQHANFSYELLQGRFPVARNYLSVIRHHHFLNEKLKQLLNKDYNPQVPEDYVHGLESVLVGAFDMLVAMTQERPYRKAMSLYQALEVLKKLIADDYPQEFKSLVIFLKQFYKI